MSIELTTTCRTCGREWQPDHTDYVRNVWRICPLCRDGPTSNHTKAGEEPRSGDPAASVGHVRENDTNREETSA